MTFPLVIAAALVTLITYVARRIFRAARVGHHLNDSTDVRCRRLHKEVIRLQAENGELAVQLEATRIRVDHLADEHDSALRESLIEVLAVLSQAGYEHFPREIAERARTLVKPLSQEKVARLLLPSELETRAGRATRRAAPVPCDHVVHMPVSGGRKS